MSNPRSHERWLYPSSLASDASFISPHAHLQQTASPCSLSGADPTARSHAGSPSPRDSQVTPPAYLQGGAKGR
ncbi:hypothetical protein M405DRAFT_831645 [Rhizopogon salebrosus TDB-379]|nr:hypothetical protein M405DRAFT_831645 [Rhizopogon salebrosus TDB-379]